MDLLPFGHYRLDSVVNVVIIVFSFGVIAVHTESVEGLNEFINHSDFVLSM